jgi:hypothetical protein
VLDAGFVCEEAILAVLAELFGARDDAVMRDTAARVSRPSSQDDEISRSLAAGENRVDKFFARLRAQHGKRSREAPVRVMLGVKDLGCNNGAQRAYPVLWIGRSFSNEDEVGDQYSGVSNPYDRNP